MQIRISRSFPSIILFFSIILAVIGIILIMVLPILGFIFLAISMFILTSTYGFEANDVTGKFREYRSAYGIKLGEWKELDQFPDMAILIIKEGMIAQSRTNVSTTLTENYYGIYLLTSSHRTKVLVNKFKDLNQAKEAITSIALELNKEVVQYNPVISERTKARRRP